MRGSLLKSKACSGVSFLRALSRATNCSPVMIVPSSISTAAPIRQDLHGWAGRREGILQRVRKRRQEGFLTQRSRRNAEGGKAGILAWIGRNFTKGNEGNE